MNTALAGAISSIEGRRIYIDSCVFIFFLEENPVYFEGAFGFLQACSDQHAFGFTGFAAMAEVMVHPYRKGDASAAASTKKFFERPQFLTLLSHTAERFDLASQLAGVQRLKMIDALHLATAIDSQCDFFVTNDFQFKSNEHLTVIQLDHLLSA